MTLLFAYSNLPYSIELKNHIKPVAATLEEYTLIFTESSDENSEIISTIIPYNAGTVLGVLYDIDDKQLKNLSLSKIDHSLIKCSIKVNGKVESAFVYHSPNKIRKVTPTNKQLNNIKEYLSSFYPNEMIDLYLNAAVQRCSVERAIYLNSEIDESFKFEYNCNLRRLYPSNMIKTPFGTAIAVLEPGQATTPHNHDEHEAFIIISGEGRMMIDDTEFSVKDGDVVYFEPFTVHSLRNSGDSHLRFLTIYWGGFGLNS